MISRIGYLSLSIIDGGGGRVVACRIIKSVPATFHLAPESLAS